MTQQDASYIDTKDFANRSDIRIGVPCVVREFVQNGTDEPFVNVQVSIRRRKYIEDRLEEFTDVEIIEEVPIGYLSTQHFAFTIPVSPGDRGYLHHSDFDLDKWNIEGEEIADPDSTFINDLNDCIFYPAIWPRPKGLDGYSQDAMVLRTIDNLTNISISPGRIEINADEIVMNGIVIKTVNPQDPPFDDLPSTAAEEKEVNRP